MKPLSSFSLDRQGCIIGVLNALLAIGLTVISFRYIQPKDCYRAWAGSEGVPYPAGACGFGGQKAGWPLPAFVDTPGGGSPTSGWGLLGPEDPPDFVPLLLDVLFYSLIVWLALYIIQFVRRRAVPLRLIITSLPLNFFLGIFLCIFYWSFGSPIGRGHSVQVYVDTPTDRGAGSAFLPTVSIPLEELIENYGDPDEVWLTSEGSAQKPLTQVLLHWAPIGMFVQLAETASETYPIKKTTEVEMIIFPYEEPVIAFDGKPLGEKKIPWTGYGNYQP
jgi:hypothetical protein